MSFYSTGEAIDNLPVIIKGSELKKISGGERFSAASIRIIGQEGEIPSQLDEYDGLVFPPSSPNRLIDDNDELVFQVSLPSTGKVDYWLYWNTSPVPPPKYDSLSLAGDAMDPDMQEDDIQIWNDRIMLGMKGPSRGKDPVKNQLDNWGSGAVTLFEIDHFPIIKIHSGWGWRFPGGALGSSPDIQALRWQRPKILFKGPVRIAAATTLEDYEIEKPTAKMDIHNRVWLYEKGSWVCFDQILIPESTPFTLSTSYTNILQFGTQQGEKVWYSKNSELLSCSIDKNNIEEAMTGKKIVFRDSGIDNWMAGYSVDGKKPSHGFFIEPAEHKDIKQSFSFYSRNNFIFVYSLKVDNLSVPEPVSSRFWVTTLSSDKNGKDAPAVWQALKELRMETGTVEKKGKR